MVSFLHDKSNALQEFFYVCRELQSLKNMTIVSKESDHGRKLERIGYDLYCARLRMIFENDLPKTFWAEVVNIAKYV